jgi:hypothetical protein
LSSTKHAHNVTKKNVSDEVNSSRRMRKMQLWSICTAGIHNNGDRGKEEGMDPGKKPSRSE